jgi:hypothetical protein
MRGYGGDIQGGDMRYAIALLLITSPLLLNCSWRPPDPHKDVAYTVGGDGHFVDRGDGSAEGRFELDLGLVDLQIPGLRRFHFAGLPRETFYVVLELTLPPELPLRVDPRVLSVYTPGGDASIQLSLACNERPVATSEHAELSQWNWSVAYCNPPEVYVYPEPQWWFDADPSDSCEITLDVVEPSTRPAMARLVVTGGGRKT